MGTADEQRRRRVGLAGSVTGGRERWGRSRCGGMMGQMRKAGMKRETDGGGRLFSFTVSLLPSTVLCLCNTPPPLLRLFKSSHNNINNNNNNDHDNAKKIYINPSHVSRP